MDRAALVRRLDWGVKHAVPPLCPVLLAVFPVLSLFSQNQPEVELSLLWPPIVICIAVALALFGVFFLITKRFPNAGLLSSVVVFGFLYHGVFFGQRAVWFLALWLALLAFAIVALLRSRRDVFNLTVILVVAAAAMVVPQAIKVVRYHSKNPLASADDPRLWPTALEAPSLPSGETPPDIFVIIPDDYARADILLQYFGYDDSEFLSELEQRGFVVSTENRSPYAYSELNIAALMNMDYLTNWPDVVGETSQDLNLVKRVSEDSRAARLLQSIGYDYVHLDTDEVTFAGGNPGISPFASPDSFSNLWLSKSILREFGGPFGFDDDAINARFRHSIGSEFAELRAIRSGPKPKFVVFHTLLPHDPFIFDADGKSITFPPEGDHTGRLGMEYYVEQLKFLQTEMLDAIDEILANAATPPVIVIQADEGFEVDPDLFGEEASQDIRIKGMSALLLPGLDHPGLPDPPNSVNVLRFVFNHYFGTHYAMLDTVSHLEGDAPFEFTEIRVA